MATEIIFDTAQDEVCTVQWEVLEALKQRTLAYIGDNPHDDAFSKEVADMLFLMDRAGGLYRMQAEAAPDLWARMRAERATLLDFLKENNDSTDLPLISEWGTTDSILRELEIESTTCDSHAAINMVTHDTPRNA